VTGGALYVSKLTKNNIFQKSSQKSPKNIPFWDFLSVLQLTGACGPVYEIWLCT
jgi:hypothetical protein